MFLPGKMDDILVIILTLIVALVGFFGKKKQKENQASQSQQAKQPHDLWNVLMFDEDVPAPVEEQEDHVAVETAEEKVAAAPEKQPVYRFDAQEEGASDIQDELKRTALKKRKKVKVCGEEFSLRKAVIYNEILNRKYT